MFKNLCVLIPAFNEEKSISSLISQIPEFQHFKSTIVVVNDGSTDKTAQLARQIGAIVVSNRKNMGLGQSLKVGLRRALILNSDYIIILDADGQYDPKDINKLLTIMINENADIVMGNRFKSNFEPEITLLKKFANKILSTFICKILLRLDEIFDVQSSFRAFTSNFGKFIYNTLEGKYNYAQEMFINAVLNGFSIKQIPINCFKREYGKSKLIKNFFVHVFKVLSISLRTYISIKIRTYLRGFFRFNT